MKICLINNLYKPFNRGGAERIAEITKKGLEKAGHEVFVITTRPWLAHLKGFEKEQNVYYLRSFYSRLRILPVFFRLFWHVYDMFDYFSCRQAGKIITKENPDVVIGHNLKGISYLLPSFIRRLGVKYVQFLHDIQLLYPSGIITYGNEKKLDSFLARTYRFFCRKLSNRANLVISPSNWLLKEHLKKGFFPRSKNKVLLNPIEAKKTGAYKPLPQKRFFDFLYIGHLSSAKGFFVLREAFGLLKKETGAGIKLFIAGKDLLPKSAGKRLFDPDVINLGFVSRTKINELLSACDCLVMPSLCYENSPTVIYEAAARGLPAIASNIGGSPELIGFFGGMLFEPGNSGELKDKMLAMIKKPGLRDSISRQGINKSNLLDEDNYIGNLIAFINA